MTKRSHVKTEALPERKAHKGPTCGRGGESPLQTQLRMESALKIAGETTGVTVFRRSRDVFTVVREGTNTPGGRQEQTMELSLPRWLRVFEIMQAEAASTE